MTLPLRLCALVAVAATAAACSRPESASARAKAPAAKPIQVEAVRRDTVKRSVDVVGTLAAVDQVTISSEADGIVAKILADLGDKVTAGQVLIQLDREKAQYTLDQQQAAL
ncbi:MAG: biotin/lipoyl-binding protein, partial [Vicinamibacterales bacterium]